MIHRRFLRLLGQCAVAGLFALVDWTAAYADPNSVRLEEYTWTELKAAIAAGKTTIILPIGGTEQSGPDIALGKHNARVKVLSERIAQALGNALVAPVLPYVPEGRIEPPEEHMRFPGTISIPTATFEAVLTAAARSFKLHGFRNIVLIGDHGGYQASLVRAAAELNRQWLDSGVRAFAIVAYYSAATEDFSRQLKAHGYTDAEIGTHAGLADASLTLALAPDLVRRQHLADDVPSAALGEYGDPRRASAELGSVGAELIVSRTVSAIQEALAARAPAASLHRP